jgi:hypothetical protein
VDQVNQLHRGGESGDELINRADIVTGSSALNRCIDQDVVTIRAALPITVGFLVICEWREISPLSGGRINEVFNESVLEHFILIKLHLREHLEELGVKLFCLFHAVEHSLNSEAWAGGNLHPTDKRAVQQTIGNALRIDVNSVRFLTPDIAIEDGTTTVIPPDNAPPSQARYTNIHVKKDGQWVLQSVREAPYTPPGNYEHLRGLEWAIGEWIDEGDGPEVGYVTFEWSPEGNFIISTQAVTVKDTLVSRVTEWIGWDPTRSQVRSWSFEADGGIGEGIWSNQGDQWIIKTNAILPDGKKLAATNVVTRTGPDAITWQSKDRTLDGKDLPDVKETKMKRVPLNHT